MSITKSRRNKFTAAHLTPEAKEALQKTAKREKKSVSAVVAEAVDEMLERDAQQPAEPPARAKSTR